MTKKSILIRNSKRLFLVEKYKNKRLEIKNIIKNINISYKDKLKYILKLQKFPRNSSKSRLRNRCYITGRSRSFIRRFGLSRIKLREMAVLGLIPGLKKSSW